MTYEEKVTLHKMNPIACLFIGASHGQALQSTNGYFECCTKPFSSPPLIECFWRKNDDFPMDLRSLKKYIVFWLTPPPP